MATRRLEVVIAGDASGAKRALGEVEQQTGRTGDKLTALSDKFKNIGQTLTLGVTLPIVGAGVVVGKWASDAEENLNKVDVVFGQNAGVIRDWARDAETAFGLSEGQAAGFFGSIGTMLEGFGVDAQTLPDMSKNVLTLAADLGSFHNLNTPEVLDMISAAFIGEYDSIQRVIPSMSAYRVEQEALAMTGKTSADQLTAQEKALATYQLLLEGAGPATGDFARTQDGAANSMRVAEAQIRSAGEQIGSVFMPIVAEVAGLVAGWADSFANLDQRTQTIIVAVAAAAAALGPLVWIIGQTITVVKALGAALTFLQANPIVLIIAAIAAVVAGLIWAYNNVDWFRNAVDAAWDAVQVAFEALKNVAVAVWDAIVAAAQWAWNTVLKPIWDAIYWYIENILVPYYTMLWNIAVAVFQGIAAVVSWAWENVIKPAWDAIAGFITTYMVPYWQMLWDIAVAVWNGISAAVSWAWDSVIRPAWDAIYGFIANYLIPYWQMLWTVATEVWNGVGNAVQWAWNSLIRPAFDAVAGGVRWVTDTFYTVRDGIANAFSGVYDIITWPFTTAFGAIQSWWNSTVGGFGFSVPSWVPFAGGKSFTIPYMHTGGIFQAPIPGGEGLAVLRDGERIMTPTQHAANMGSAPPVVNVTYVMQQTVEGQMLREREAVEWMRNGFIDMARRTPGTFLPGVTTS